MVGWLGILIDGSFLTESGGGLLYGIETCGRKDTGSFVKEVEGGMSMSGRWWKERRE